MKFKPEDFQPKCKDTIDYIGQMEMAEIANTILKEWLDAAPTVYSDEQRLWTNYKDEDDKVLGKLVCIEEIKKECDEHWPIGSAEPYKIVCQKCGATLLQQWRAVK